MGIKGLPNLIKSVAGVKILKFKKFKKIKVAVDNSLLLHQTVIAMRSSGKDMLNNNGELTSYLHGIFFKILAFLKNEITPIFVFDGKPPEMKNNTILLRNIKKDLAIQKMEEINDSDNEEYIKNFKQSFKITNQYIVETQILLDLMGIPYIIAPQEADVICAWLASRTDDNGKLFVDGVCSDDSDMLPLGANYLFKDILRFMNGYKQITVINLNKTLKKMDITMDQFIDLCIMLGTDYNTNIPGIGPKKSYKLIKKYKTLENIFEFLNNIELTDLQQQFIQIRKYFKNSLIDIDQNNDFVISEDQLYLRRYQYNELMDFMCTKHNFDPIIIHNGIQRLEEYYNILHITKLNTKHVHSIINPKIQINFNDDIEFLSSSS